VDADDKRSVRTDELEEMGIGVADPVVTTSENTESLEKNKSS
jgi:hypothetical protein